METHGVPPRWARGSFFVNLTGPAFIDDRRVGWAGMMDQISSGTYMSNNSDCMINIFSAVHMIDVGN